MTAPAVRPPILNRALVLVFVASFGAMTGFYLLLSVVPLYAESVGAGGVGAGLATGALMATTVAGELAIPRLLARFGHRAVLAAGLVLLGAPALALPASSTMAAILAVSLVRGLGFAICVVVGGALVPSERRGEGLGLFGIVVGVPGVAALALPRGSGGLAALALFVQAVGSTLSRWWAGRHGDRHGPAVLFVPGMVTAAAGILALVLIDRPAAVLAAMALFGAGFGATQNASMTLMLNRVAPSTYGTVSAIWNLAYDAGIGVGAFGFGVVAARTGYPPAFAVTAALMLAALVLRPARPARPATIWPS